MAEPDLHPTEADILMRYAERTVASRAHDARAKNRLPGGDTRTATYYPPYPAYMVEGRGCYLYDADGNKYLDLLNNYTSLLHGHAHPAVVEAARRQLEKGIVLGAAGEIQSRHAEHLCARIPSLERVRYCNSGTEATMFALRAARAYTGKDGFIKMDGGYHGSHDQAAVSVKPEAEGPVTARPAPGVPASVLNDVFVAPFNDLDAAKTILKAEADKIAAILVEPVIGAGGGVAPRPGYLAGLRELAERYDVLLIFDEVMTFRLGYGGFQEICRVEPDLTALGKIIGGGFPVGAFGGRAEIMARFDPAHPRPITHSGTFNGNNITLAAGLTALELYDRSEVERLNDLGERLREGFETALAETGLVGCVAGYGSLLTLHWRAEKPVRAAVTAPSRAADLPRLLHLELMNRGLYSAPRGQYVLSTPMGRSEVEAALAAFKGALETLKPYIADVAPELIAA